MAVSKSSFHLDKGEVYEREQNGRRVLNRIRVRKRAARDCGEVNGAR